MDMQLKILELAKKRGWDPTNLSATQYTVLSIEARTIAELARDAARAGASLVRTRLVGIRIRPELAEANRRECESNACGKFRRLSDTRAACDACNCQSELLESKWMDPNERCPLGRWDNTEEAARLLREREESKRGA